MAVVAPFTNDQLSIIGDSAADTVVVSTVDVGGVAQVTVNGQSVGAGVNASAVTSIFANLGGGNDSMNLSTLDLSKFSGLADGSIEIRGGAGNDTLVGSPLGDILKGEDGNDSLTGGAGNDHLIGGNGSDALVGGAGDDTLDGGLNDDVYSFSGATDLGSDTIIQAASGNLDTLGFGSLGGAIVVDISMTTPQVVRAGQLTLTLSDGAGIDNVQGTAYDDVILGNSGGNSLMGNRGNDYLWGRRGNDWLDGGAGNDTLYGGDGNDTLLGKSGNDSLYGHAGDDTLNGNEGNDYLSGDEGNDTYIVTNYGTKTIGGAASGDTNVLNLAGQVLAAPLNLASTSVQVITPSLSVRFTDPHEINWVPGAGDNGEHAGGLYKAGYYTVSGVEGTSTTVEFIYGGEIADYNNSVYVYDATGSPESPSGTPLFVANSPEPPKSLVFPADKKLGFYILQNNIDGMNGNASTRFYADDAKNTYDDDPGSHSRVHAYDLEPGLLQLSWEDLFYQRPNPLGFIQDTDFNDMYIGVRVTDYTAIDLDIDSDNNGYINSDKNVDRRDAEDVMEETVGKPITYFSDFVHPSPIAVYIPMKLATADAKPGQSYSFSGSSSLKVLKRTDGEPWGGENLSWSNSDLTEVVGGQKYDLAGAQEWYYVKAIGAGNSSALDALTCTVWDSDNSKVQSDTVQFAIQDNSTKLTSWVIPNDWTISGESTKTPMPHADAVGPQAEWTGLSYNEFNKGDAFTKETVSGSFTLDMTVSFDERQVQPDNNKTEHTIDGDARKLSFVANSGVKIGAVMTPGGVDARYEVALIDVVSWVDKAGGLEAFNKATAWEDDKVIAKDQDGQAYAKESLRILMPGVFYRAENFDGIADAAGTTATPGTWEYYYEILARSYRRMESFANGTFQMRVSYASDSNGGGMLSVGIKAVGANEFETVYTETNPDFGSGDTRISLQSHWGSGVTFANISSS